MKTFHLLFNQENINLILILSLIIILYLLFRINVYCKKNSLQISIFKNQVDSQYKQIEALQNTINNINLKLNNEKHNKDFDELSPIVDAKNQNINSNLSSASFDKIYDLIFNDVKHRKINKVGDTLICIIDKRIGFGRDRRSESKENMKILFNYFIAAKKTNILNLDKDDWFALISKLTKSKTNTIDYVYYRDFLQEMLNRYNKS